MKKIIIAVVMLHLLGCISVDVANEERPYPKVPKTTDDFLAKGKYYSKRKHGTRNAMEAYHHALIAAVTDKEKARAHIELGDLYFTMQRTKDAARQFLSAVKLCPDNLHARTHLGAALLCMNKYKAAIKQLDMVLEKNENYGEAYAWRGLVYGRRKLWEKAIPDFQQAMLYDLPQTLKIRLYAETANCYFITGRYNLALNTWSDMIEMEPHMNTPAVRKYMKLARLAQKDKTGS